MQWKILIAALVVLGIFAVAAFTEPGRQYTGFLAKHLGNFISGILKSERFEFALKANKEAFYEQEFQLSGSKFTASGAYELVSIDGKIWELKSTKELSVSFAGSGKVTLNKDGKLIISASTNSVDLNDFVSKSDDKMDVKIEMMPSNFALSNIIEGEITLSSATGEINKMINNTFITAKFSKSNIIVSNFNGSVELVNETISLVGYATEVKSSDFKI